MARYIDYREALRLIVGPALVPNAIRLEFRQQVPDTWSEKKKQQWIGKLQSLDVHARSDTDNLIKAIADAIWPRDGGIAVMQAAKFWDKENFVVLECFYLEPGDDQSRLFPEIL